jgi:hypothetical protein|nr:MAG TPA: tail assembly chaperone [Myoviridae sp. ct6nn14]
MNGFRIDTGLKRIEVNDEGEYIELQLGDATLFQRVSAFMAEIQKTAEILAARTKEAGFDAEAFAAFYAEAHAELMQKVDALFGEGTCRKVFGSIVPGTELLIQFFEELMPYFEAHAKAQRERLGKYSAERTGDA